MKTGRSERSSGVFPAAGRFDVIEEAGLIVNLDFRGVVQTHPYFPTLAKLRQFVGVNTVFEPLCAEIRTYFADYEHCME